MVARYVVVVLGGVVVFSGCSVLWQGIALLMVPAVVMVLVGMLMLYSGLRAPELPESAIEGTASCRMCGGALAHGFVRPNHRAAMVLYAVGLLLLPVLVGVVPLVVGMTINERRGVEWRCRQCGAVQ